MTTKIEAIKLVMQDNGGTATLQEIYDNAGTYYPNVDAARDWKAGLRGVLYREIRNGRTFKKIGMARYGLLHAIMKAA